MTKFITDPEHITNFNKFDLDLEKEWDENLEMEMKSATITDETGYFFGQYQESKNKKYIVVFDDAYEKEQGKK